MEGNKENKGWMPMPVPAFGEWDMKNGAVPDYSFDFSKLREMRKNSKNRSSYGNEEELLRLQNKIIIRNNKKKINDNDDKKRRRSQVDDDGQRRTNHHHHRAHSPTGMKRFINYFQCCIGA